MTASTTALTQLAARPPRLLFVVNSAEFFLSHRLPVALAAAQAGYAVAVASPAGPGAVAIARRGFTHHPISLERGGSSPLSDGRTTVELVRLFRRVRPDIVHAVTIKPVIYGGIAARIAGVPAFLAAISGLGYTFVEREDGATPLRAIAERLYRVALRHGNARAIFQNDADRDAFARMGAIAPHQARMIRGSGVDLDLFRPSPERAGVPLVVLPARMLRDKGVAEFAKAAAILKARQVRARFVLVGDVDPGNPASCTVEELRGYVSVGLVDWWGHRADMAEIMAAAHLVVLPSYREGFPKVLMEAAAAGRAVVATDVPGCRDAVVPGVTGCLVGPRDAAALADAIGGLLAEPGRRRAMGRAGRQRAEREFGVAGIAAAHLEVHSDLIPTIAEGEPQVSAA